MYIETIVCVSILILSLGQYITSFMKCSSILKNRKLYFKFQNILEKKIEKTQPRLLSFWQQQYNPRQQGNNNQILVGLETVSFATKEHTWLNSGGHATRTVLARQLK